MDDARRQAILERYAVRAEVFEEIARHSHLHTQLTAEEPADAVPAHHDPTEREVEVLELIAAGASNVEIAHRLTITEETVKSHVRHLLWKLDAHNRAHAVALGFHRGLLHAPPAPH